MIAAICILGIAASSTLTFLMPRTYSAQAHAFVTITSSGTASNSLYQNSQFALQRVKSYPQVISSPDVLQPVIDTLHLKVSLEDLRKTVTAENPPDTVLLNVTAESTSAAEAQLIANLAAKHLGTAVETLETSRSGGVPPVKVTNAVPASLPDSPVSPRPALNLALGLMIGLALGIWAAVLREQTDTTVKDDDLQNLTGMAPLGVVGFDPDAETNPVMDLSSHSPRLEAFRSIRTNLQFIDVDNPPRQIVITSARADEGKTTTACNLAITLAQSAMRVCLVEADMRRPKVATYLGIDEPLGLTNVLAGQLPLDDALVSWGRKLLTVLPSGTPPPDPSQLLGSKNMTVLLADLRSRFDMVIIDAPPLLQITDAAVLAQATDGALFVSRHGHTSRDLVARALENLDTVNARLIGTVLTFAPTTGSPYGYGDYGRPSAGSPASTGSRWRIGRRRNAGAALGGEPNAGTDGASRPAKHSVS